MADLNSRLRLIDFFAAATSDGDHVRRGFTEATVTGVGPLMVRLDLTDGDVPATAVNYTPTASDVGARVLVFENGAALRYCLGVLHG